MMLEIWIGQYRSTEGCQIRLGEWGIRKLGWAFGKTDVLVKSERISRQRGVR